MAPRLGVSDRVALDDAAPAALEPNELELLRVWLLFVPLPANEPPLVPAALPSSCAAMLCMAAVGGGPACVGLTGLEAPNAAGGICIAAAAFVGVGADDNAVNAAAPGSATTGVPSGDVEGNCCIMVPAETPSSNDGGEAEAAITNAEPGSMSEGAGGDEAGGDASGPADDPRDKLVKRVGTTPVPAAADCE